MNAYDSSEGRANVAAIESKLAELDEVFREFCIRENYTFSAIVNLWPRRRVWRRQEIDRCMDLTMTIGVVGVQDVLDRGFYPDLPWSLYASGSLLPATDPENRILSHAIFEQVRYSQLAGILADSLERGLKVLDSMTENDILTQGQKWGESATTSNKKNVWPFDQPRNCATFTTRQVLDELEPIALVSHDADDHAWQFIGTSGAVEADARIVALEEIVDLDPTVLEIADLEPGWQALRETVGGPWLRRVHPSVPDDEG
jgi:hypothetical protein